MKWSKELHQYGSVHYTTQGLSSICGRRLWFSYPFSLGERLGRLKMGHQAAELSIGDGGKRQGRRLIQQDSLTEIYLNLGRFLLVLPMLIYPMFHFLNGRGVAVIVPPWIPWRLFWTYFTGTSILAAGLSILFKKSAHVPALLLGIEIFLFVMLIHLFLIFHKPGDVWAQRLLVEDSAGELNNCFKDLGLSGAVFIFAGTQSEAWRTSGRDSVLAFGRTILAVCIIAFGVLHFIYPAFAPGIQPMFESVAFPIPGHLFWVYASGIALLAAGICILVNWKTRVGAAFIGIMVLVFELLTRVPGFFKHPLGMTGDWLKDLGIIGGALILAGALPKEDK
jgi:uncharacterized membrane protein